MTDPTLAEWLLAQVAEDEAVARAALSLLRWRWMTSGDEIWAADLTGDNRCECHGPDDQPNYCDDIYVGDIDTDFVPIETAEHIARHDPARVLAECEAKRRVVELHVPWPGHHDGRLICDRCHDGDEYGDPEADWPCQTLRAIAVPYADRPGYRAEWRPGPTSETDRTWPPRSPVPDEPGEVWWVETQKSAPSADEGERGC